jgi:hypothetical protein
VNYSIPEHIVARFVHDDIMILDSRQGRYLGLNGTGAVVWSVIANGGSTNTAVDELAFRYDISRETAESDVTSLIKELLQLSIIVPSAP